MNNYSIDIKKLLGVIDNNVKIYGVECKCQFKYVKKIQNKNVHFIHLPFGKNL